MRSSHSFAHSGHLNLFTSALLVTLDLSAAVFSTKTVECMRGHCGRFSSLRVRHRYSIHRQKGVVSLDLAPCLARSTIGHFLYTRRAAREGGESESEREREREREGEREIISGCNLCI
ncbi:hypothetical protein K432DRAFT_170919 [Lepidopterella palustris CBS 459.81]|uniref:Secreted protein n=1 Tax=Lepidopterella palustris CBS 459.81 TaxID=1314670 RepID=A0A8E2JB52_9PEZI|nr:hypothetical protein K432DRAFT_170919 [Lepidopterella palustris CBS 459.81]